MDTRIDPSGRAGELSLGREAGRCHGAGPAAFQNVMAAMQIAEAAQ